ncbi:Na+/H+ antiporter NhaC family protein [Algivirga pacifica]|uniref:Na+/H+ antiporter NhaC family protein n=1 Tax=Algivirga pacifica TaxID=1162670 RepID=A0ABP9CWE7_9BACT
MSSIETTATPEKQQAVPKKSGKALLPLGVFLVTYLGTSIITGDFYAFPAILAFLVAGASSLLLDWKTPFAERIALFAKGMGHGDIMQMSLIFILAGAFAQVGREMGAITSTVNLGLTLLPAEILVAGLFVVACFIAISIGTSVGTVSAVAPIGVALAEQIGLPLPMVLGAVIGGAMFGDNLSMISDTTIAASRTQGAKMSDKFQENFKIVMPAAVLTIIIYVVMNYGNVPSSGEEYPYEWIKVLPYVLVLLAAVAGVHVMIVLSGGILISGAIGLYTGAFNWKAYGAAIQTGISGMSELVVMCLIIGGMVSMIRHNGGINFIIDQILKRVKSKKGAELGIGVLISLVGACTANNTIAIIVAGPIAKDIAQKFQITPKRSASILDTFSCFAQGILPYGAQILIAVGIASQAVTPLQIMGYMFYPYLMGLSTLLFIFLKKDQEATTTA